MREVYPHLLMIRNLVVLNLEKVKDAQAKEITALKKRIQRLERKKMSRPTGLKRLKKVGMSRRLESSEDQESLVALEDASKHGRSIADIDADIEFWNADEMPVEAKVDEKDEQSIMIKPEVPLKRKDQIALDEQIARDIQVKLDAELIEEQKLARKQEEEANIALIKEKSFDEIQKLFDNEMKRVNTIVAMGSEVQESKEKKVEVEKEKESDEVDEVELRKILVIKKDEDIAIDAIPLATKLPVIIDYKLLKEGMMIHYQLIRAYGSSKRYSLMLRILQGIDREDLEALWRIVKVKYGDTRPKMNLKECCEEI
ncbi:hypothetical protein Tco_1511110 [Tanacetum coccineum]